MAERGKNLVILIGNLGNDPETRFFPDGGAITNASLATSEVWKDKQSGEQKERTEWHRLVFRDSGTYRLGQIAGEYLKKGSKIYVQGKIVTEKWTDQQGTERYTTKIYVREMQMLDSKGQDGQQGQGQRSQPQQAPPQQQSAPQAAGGFDDLDGIPF